MTANDRLDTRLPIGFATHPEKVNGAALSTPLLYIESFSYSRYFSATSRFNIETAKQ
jgi:hypothetical protein